MTTLNSPARYFGPPWDVPAVEHAEQAPTPVGRDCGICNTPVRPRDRGWLRPYLRSDGTVNTLPIHAECELASIMGHTVGICPCTGWQPSTRATAIAVWTRVFGGYGGDEPGDLGGGTHCPDPGITAPIDPAAVRAARHARPSPWKRLRHWLHLHVGAHDAEGCWCDLPRIVGERR